MENLEVSPEKMARKEPSLHNHAKETVEEKNLKEIDIITPTKRNLSEDVYYYETKEGIGGVFKPGYRYKSERAAYLVDKFFKFDLIPTTVIRNIEGKEGSYQLYIPNTKKRR